MPDALLIRDAKTVYTCGGPAPKRGHDQADARPVPRASVLAVDGVLTFVGPEADARARVPAGANLEELDASGCAVVPGFVDPHTHVVYAGDRREELRRRLAGATYAEIASSGGGILSTVRDTRAASEDELAAATRARLDDMLRAGTTTAEAKSG